MRTRPPRRGKAPPLLYRFVSACFPARVLRFPVGVVRRASGRSPAAPYYIGLLPRAFGACSRGPRGPLPGAAPRNQPREAAFERKTPLKEGAVHFIREPSVLPDLDGSLGPIPDGSLFGSRPFYHSGRLPDKVDGSLWALPPGASLRRLGLPLLAGVGARIPPGPPKCEPRAWAGYQALARKWDCGPFLPTDVQVALFFLPMSHGGMCWRVQRL